MVWTVTQFFAPQLKLAWDDLTAALTPIVAAITTEWTGEAWPAIKQAWEGRSLDPLLAYILPELKDDDITWSAVYAAAKKKVGAWLSTLVFLILPKLKEEDLTWSAVYAAAKDKVGDWLSALMFLIVPQLKDDDVTWQAVYDAAKEKVAAGLSALVFLILPKLKDEDLTWAAVYAAAKEKVGAWLSGLVFLILPKLKDEDLTWSAVYAAAKDKVGDWLSALMFLIVPQLKDDDVTWQAVYAAAKEKVAVGLSALVFLILPKLKDEDLTWAAVYAAAKEKVGDWLSSLLFLVSPKVTDEDLTWADVYAAAKDKVGDWLSALMFLIVPQLKDDDVTWQAVYAAAKEKVAVGLSALVFLILPKLKDEDLTWAAVYAAAKEKVGDWLSSLLFLVSPKVTDEDLTWADVYAAAKEKVGDWLSALVFRILPKLADEDLTWAAVYAAAKAKVNEWLPTLPAWVQPLFDGTAWAALKKKWEGFWLPVLIAGVVAVFDLMSWEEVKKKWEALRPGLSALVLDVKIAGLDGLISFWSEFLNAAKEAGGLEAVGELLNAFGNLFMRLIEVGSNIQEIVLAPLLIPLVGIISAIGGYDGGKADGLVDFLGVIGAWSGASAIAGINALAGALNLLASAIATVVTYTGMPIQTVLAMIGGFAQPNLSPQQQIEAEADATEGFDFERGAMRMAGGAGRLMGRFMGRGGSPTPETFLGPPGQPEEKKPWWSRWPDFDKGGITTGNTLARLHPDEAVIPLDRIGQVLTSYLNLPALAPAGAGGLAGGTNVTYNLGGLTVNVTVPPGVSDPEEIAKRTTEKVQRGFRDLAAEFDSPVKL